MQSREQREERRKSFEDLYAEFHPRIRRYLGRLLGEDEADDATQEVFVKASHGLAKFRGASSLSTWIYRVATNVAYDKLRSASSRRAGDVPIDTAPVRDPSAGIDERLVRAEMNDCLERYVRRLPANYRSVLILSEHEGLTNQEIAEALRLTLDTVKIRLHRARARLRADLQNDCVFYRDGRNEFACDHKPVAFLRRRPGATPSTSR